MGSSVSLKCTLNRIYVPAGKNAIVYLAMDIMPAEHTSVRESLPSAICLLIDRSGSMWGKKLNQAKAAAKGLINQLQPGDAIGLVTETSEEFSSRVPEPYTRLPDGFRATQLADGSIGTPFLELFGRPPRDTSYESDRCSRLSMPQTLHLVNSSHLEGKISKSPRVQRLLKSDTGDAQVVEEIYLAALSRRPTEEESQKAVEYLAKDKKARWQTVPDLLWAVLNSKEFLFNH